MFDWSFCGFAAETDEMLAEAETEEFEEILRTDARYGRLTDNVVEDLLDEYGKSYNDIPADLVSEIREDGVF